MATGLPVFSRWLTTSCAGAAHFWLVTCADDFIACTRFWPVIDGGSRKFAACGRHAWRIAIVGAMSRKKERLAIMGRAPAPAHEGTTPCHPFILRQVRNEGKVKPLMPRAPVKHDTPDGKLGTASHPRRFAADQPGPWTNSAPDSVEKLHHRSIVPPCRVFAGPDGKIWRALPRARRICGCFPRLADQPGDRMVCAPGPAPRV